MRRHTHLGSTGIFLVPLVVGCCTLQQCHFAVVAESACQYICCPVARCLVSLLRRSQIECLSFSLQAMFNFASCSAVATAVQMSDESGLLKTLQIVFLHAALLFVLVGGTQPISGERQRLCKCSISSFYGPWRAQLCQQSSRNCVATVVVCVQGVTSIQWLAL